MTFEQYCADRDIDASKYSNFFIDYCRSVYNKHHLSGLAFFITSTAPEETKVRLINDEIRKLYRMQLHNVGDDPFTRYYEQDLHACWLQLETLIISLATQFAFAYEQKIKEIEKTVKSERQRKKMISDLKNPLSQMHTSNRYLAEQAGWLDPFETDQAVIERACKKVTANLEIIKNDRKTISVEQHHNPGNQGSYHIITVNWTKVIDLYTNYDPKMDGSIRLRKSIRYRIMSFIRKTAKIFCNKLKNLMRLQKVSYLSDLLISFDIDDFQNDKYILYKLLSRKDFGISKRILNTKNIVPIYSESGHELTLKTKTEFAQYDLEHNALYLTRYFESFGVKLSIVAN